MSTPIKYNTALLPASAERQPGDFVLLRMTERQDQYEQVVIRPVNGARFLFDAEGIVTFAENIQNATPTAGQTVTMTNNAVDSTLNLTPAGTLATLTITLPTNAASRIGQIERITTSQAITTLTINGATTIRGNVTTLAANGFVAFQKIANDTWARIN